MIGVDKIGQIRRAYFEQHRSIKEIVRTLSVSRATVRKVIRGHKTEFKYARGVQPTPKLGDWVEVLTEILEQEAKLPKRERRSTQRLFEELRGRGYAGAHDSVHRFVKAWRDERLRVPVHAYVPMSFAPGEAYQFDWSHETITLQGLPLTVKAAHMKLSHSRMLFVRVYFRETQERTLKVQTKVLDGADVAVSGSSRHVADRHVIDHALPQRRNLFSHGVLLLVGIANAQSCQPGHPDDGDFSARPRA